MLFLEIDKNELSLEHFKSYHKTNFSAVIVLKSRFLNIKTIDN